MAEPPMTSLFFQIVIDWELVAIACTVLLTSYFVMDLVLAILRPPGPRRYSRPPHLPVVSVVIPVYNESIDIVRSTLTSWREVRYPSFELIVADDSTIPLELGDSGVRVIHRANRDGFKGGALRNAFARLDPASEWVLVFDADFLVEPDVLIRFAQHFKEGVGGIQGCLAMGRNPRPSFLTRFSEASHQVSNQLLAGRYERRGFVAVQGTVQAYRVEAIRSIGGIAPYTTANEDLDSSFRLRKAGWKIVYDPRIVSRGLAPTRYLTFFKQITRWTSTTVREYRRHWGSFLRSRRVPLGEKLDSALFLLTWTNSLIISPTLAFLPWALLFLHVIPLWLAVLVTFLPFALFALPMVRGTPPRLALTGWLWYYVMLLPGYFVMYRASLLGLLTEPGFERTPKSMAEESRSSPVPVSAPVRHPSRLGCDTCGRPLSASEVLFYAVGGLDVRRLRCRRCLGHVEWRRYNSGRHVALST